MRRWPLLACAASAVWWSRIRHVQAGIPRAADYWSVPRGEAGGLLYVALGDSAAQGIGASHPDRGYVGLLADRLRAATGSPVQVVNLSRSGATLQDVVDQQIPRLLQLSPDLVTVAVGGNDMFHPAPERFDAAATELVTQLPAGTLLADVPYFMHGRWERAADRAARVLTLHAQQVGLTVVPLHATLRDLGWKAMATHFAADWFHPNDRGHRVWADAFWSAYQSTQPEVDPLAGGS